MKRGFRFILAAGLGLAMVLVSGCTYHQAPDVMTHIDQWSGLRTDLMAENLLEAGEHPRELIWLNASRVYENYSKYSYYLEVTYMARKEVGMLEINPGASLTLYVDNEKVPLVGSGSLNSQEETKEGLVQENAIYKVSKPLLQKIAIARKVRVVVEGKNGTVEREFNEENFDKYRRFVTRYAL